MIYSGSRSHARQQWQRSEPVRSAARCYQDQSGQQSARSIGRCRLLLDRQSSHAEPATDQRLHRNRTTKARQQVRYREAAGQTRLASRQDDQPAQARRPSQPLPPAQAGGRAGIRTGQGGERVPPVPLAGNREGEGRMGDDLHRPQPRKTRPGRRMSTFMISLRPATTKQTGS